MTENSKLHRFFTVEYKGTIYYRFDTYGPEYTVWMKVDKADQVDNVDVYNFLEMVYENVDLDIIKECRQTGKTRTTTKNLLEKAYYEQMTNEIDISTVGQHAKVLIEGDTVTIMGEKYKRVEEPEVLKTLYDALQLPYFTNGYHFNEGQKDWICKVVEEWLSQFHPDDMSFENLSYSNAFFDALDLVRKTLR